MKKYQIMISSLVVWTLSCNNALADIASGNDCGPGCSWHISDDGVLTVNGADKNSRMNDYTFDYDKNTAPWGVYRDKINTVNVDIENVGNYAFFILSAVKTLNIGDSVTSIGDESFYGMYNVTNLTIPDSIRNIGNQAFQNMDLTNLTIPDSVTSIGDYAFADMFDLQSLTISDSVTSIGNGAFQYMENLTDLTIGNSVTTIGEEAFAYMHSIENLTIPDSVVTIADYAFLEMNNLRSLTIPDFIESIGTAAFAGMSSLQSLTLPNSVKSIGEWAFADMSENAQIYCEGEMCDILETNRDLYGLGSQELILYSKDENGVYDVNGVFYSSSENMQAGISCGSQAACAEEIKNAKQTQTSSGEETHIVRRIYTVEEATEAVSGKGKNTFTIRYR